MTNSSRNTHLTMTHISVDTLQSRLHQARDLRTSYLRGVIAEVKLSNCSKLLQIFGHAKTV